ncbi:Periplasmic solute binding protein family protein [Marinomonas aquimarina]|uniref:Periplasmic solute binding protein family protein n=1 Tax=Marinomonas aquimarina TaxID=295068 RepID=A0A1A8TCV9_9GAMM|nr:zinc ABC transporter solute-binding protein [Marinomonas aquimarina]SBS29761.1 Periplasmic solute binding protein family protein [Marinomonas aquimarina]
MRLIVSSLFLLLANMAVAANIATVTPIAYSMTSALVADSDIEATYLPPTRLPINRIPSWLKRNDTEPMAHFDAIVNISSLRPELDFYKPLRSTNVRIVPIDIAQALIPGGEQVATHEADEYFWLNSNNALLMLGILKRDLIALWPDQAEQISANFQATSKALRQVALDIDDALLMSGYDALSTAKASLTPFSKSLLLPTLGKEEQDGMNTLIINTKGGDQTWQVDDFSRFSKQSFIERWQAVLQGIPTA